MLDHFDMQIHSAEPTGCVIPHTRKRKEE
jgi:hypothetical protein